MNELKHYGVLGMKWGVRKDRELKGRRSKKLSEIEAVKHPTNEDSNSNKPENKDETNSRGEHVEVTVFEEDDARIERLKNERISREQPHRYALENVAKDRLDNLPKYSYRDLSEKQQISQTNHDAPSEIRKINCFECTMAYEMRQRGYNVQANEVPGGRVSECYHAFDVKDAFTVKVSSNSYSQSAAEAYRQMEEACLKYGEGARGMIGFSYASYNAGHAQSWEVKNGQFRLIDSQALGRTAKETFLKCDGKVTVVRLDNAEVLPGVTDFVEAYQLTDEEKEEIAENVKKKKEIYEKRKAAKAKDEWTKENREIIEKRKEAKARLEYQKKKNQTIVDELVKSVKKVSKDLVNAGKDFLENGFQIKSETKITTSTFYEDMR